MSIFVLNLATLLGLGLGVDYSLLLTSRFREELKARGGGRDPATGRADQDAVNDAVAATVATAGRAVFFSGLTVLLGLIGLILFEFMVLRSVGIAGAMVVGLAVASAITLLPAVLATLGPRIDAYPIKLRQRLAKRVGLPVAPPAAEGEGAWGRLARRVMDHPVRVFVPTLLLLLLLWARPSCTCTSTRRTPQSCRPTCPAESRSTCSPRTSARASSRRSCWRCAPTARSRIRRTWHSCTTTRADLPLTHE